MRFFDAERKKNNKFRRNQQKKNLPWIVAHIGEIDRKEYACNKAINYMAVVFSLFPNRIKNKKSNKRNRKGIDKNQPPVESGNPAKNINQKGNGPDSKKNKRGYDLAVEVAFLFFKAFRRFPTIVGVEKIIDGNAKNLAHFFKNICVGNSLGSFPF